MRRTLSSPPRIRIARRMIAAVGESVIVRPPARPKAFVAPAELYGSLPAPHIREPLASRTHADGQEDRRAALLADVDVPRPEVDLEAVTPAPVAQVAAIASGANRYLLHQPMALLVSLSPAASTALPRA